jgi:hypothetical protein
VGVRRNNIQLAAALRCSLDDLFVKEDGRNFFVVALGRSHGTVALCCNGTSIVEVRGQGCRRGGHQRALLAGEELAADYGAPLLLTDVHIPLQRNPNIHREVVDFAAVAQQLDAPRRGTATLSRIALEAWPHLSRYVNVLRGTGRIASDDRRGQLLLVAAAVAIAQCRRGTQIDFDFLQLELPFET